MWLTSVQMAPTEQSAWKKRVFIPRLVAACDGNTPDKSEGRGDRNREKSGGSKYQYEAAVTPSKGNSERYYCLNSSC